ncbi:hypothetical protein [Anaerofustis stercorihominis]|uniref:Uncharacterized protein n=1 Tax=Anaerofustis stercorihominis TaxID=214853 RepID=A0A3E3E155_9FIRM|nr:hypothetical protein [Anaerofustis stercorihominis]RGD75282.1 hypothetical protein DW687_02860 [Anaerofustis stercorihominis]
MNILKEKEESILAEIINIISDPNKTVFGYFKEKIDNNKDIINTLKSLEDNGLIKIDNMEDYPINIELTDLGKNYFTDKENNIEKVKAECKKRKNRYIIVSIISFILGVIMGIFLCHLFII